MAIVVCIKVMRKIMNKLLRHKGYIHQYSNPGLPEFQAGMLTTTPQRLIIYTIRNGSQ